MRFEPRLVYLQLAGEDCNDFHDVALTRNGVLFDTFYLRKIVTATEIFFF